MGEEGAPRPRVCKMSDGTVGLYAPVPPASPSEPPTVSTQGETLPE